MKTNLKATAANVTAPRTHEGAIAKRIDAEQQLRRSVMAHMLWEDEFYESGVEIAKRIADLVKVVDAEDVAKIAVEARTRMKLRHVPLLLVRSLAATAAGPIVAKTLAEIIQRPDEITEFLSIYWKDRKPGGKRPPLAWQVRQGLAKAFEKFDEYSFAKYDRDEELKLRDALFMVHGKTKDIVRAGPGKGLGAEDAHGDVVFVPPIKRKGYKRGKVRRHGGSLAEKIVMRTLETPDTWEVKLTEAKTPAAKLKVWTGLLERKHLGALALLRNLRNMQQVGVPMESIRTALENMKVDRVLPFRFLTAARYAPKLETELEQAMFRCLADQEKLPGETVLVLDVSGSMDSQVSGKSEVTRMDAACGVAILVREICEDVGFIAFSTRPKVVASRRGIALRDAVVNSMDHGGTNTADALKLAAKEFPNARRCIVITDEQSHQSINAPPWPHAYVINVASNQNGIGYGNWWHIDGWSEAVVDYIREAERAGGE